MGPRSSTPSLDSDSQKDIEMAPLHKIPTPQGGSTQSLLAEDYDDDADDGDAGERPLLREEMQTNWQEKNSMTFWRQTSGIVVEVRTPRITDLLFLDPRNPRHYRRSFSPQ